MRIMEDKSRKNENEKVEGIQTEQYDANHVLKRPKSFSLRRRSEAYYFSDDSENGIIKRVPIKYGCYKYNELKTVLEGPDSEKNHNEIWSDVPLNTPEGTKSDKNRTAATNEDSYEAIHPEKKNDNVLKSPEVTTDIKLLSKGLNNLAMIKDNKEDLKHENDGKKQLRVSNRGQKEGFHKSFQRPKQKKYKTNVSVSTHYEKSKISDEKYENHSTSNMTSSSSKKSEEPEDEPFNADELNMMQMKTPVTEL